MSTDESIRNYIISFIGTKTAPKAPMVQIKSSTSTATMSPSNWPKINSPSNKS